MTKVQTKAVKLVTLIFLGLLSCLLLGQLRLVHDELRKTEAKMYDPVLPPLVYQVFSFGMLPTVVDYFWLKVIGDDEIFRVPPNERAYIYSLYDLLTELDPRYRQGYMVGAKLLAVVRNDIEGAQKLLEKANRYVKEELPKYSKEWRENFWYPEWEVPFLLGYIHLIEKSNVVNAEKYLIEASEYETAPYYLKSLGERLKKPTGKFEVALKILNTLIENEQKKESKNKSETLTEYIKKRDSVFVKEYLFHLNDEFQEYLKTKSKYKKLIQIPPKILATFFKDFMKQKRYSLRDPFGGAIFLSLDGKVTSSTKTIPVLGLE